MLQALKNKEKKIAVLGLGYVGLPLALEFACDFSVIGFDINDARVNMMKNHEDPSRELPSSAFENRDIIFTSNIDDLKEAHFYIVAVPTPIDQHKVPDLGPVFSASTLVGKVIKPGDYVVYESTVYPGCTEEDCLPLIEKESGLKAGLDFKYGYSPERINPGDQHHTVRTIIKVVSGNDTDSSQVIGDVYESVITAGVFRAATVKVAEAAKVIENTQRDLNIAFMNELSIIFDRMEIDTQSVLEAAATKWNFLKFTPGLVGGHCIGVDPYYLTYKSEKLGYSPEVILSGRRINDGIPAFLAKRLAQMLLHDDIRLKGARVLVMGVTFKENVSDIRNSKVADLISELQDYLLEVDVVDPFADPQEVHHEYGLTLCSQPSGKYNAVVLAVSHQEYIELSSNVFKELMGDQGILMDVKGIRPDLAILPYTYWRM